mgnify:CR=1 FL=1|tara:strand:+ start:2241 stop:2948 length:708 start_codon:yes stop_codon:yes gene_type:complete
MDMKRTLGRFEALEGRILFPSLNAPDRKFNDSPELKGRQKFRTNLRLDGDAASAAVAMLEAAWANWLGAVQAATGKKPKVISKNIQWLSSVTPRWEEIGESTEKLLDDMGEGELIIKTGCSGWDRKSLQSTAEDKHVMTPPVFFDASGAGIKFKDLPPIGPGTHAKLTGDLYGYTTNGTAAMILILKAVQIIDLIEGGGQKTDAEDFGFTPAEGFKSEVEQFIDTLPADDQGGNF